MEKCLVLNEKIKNILILQSIVILYTFTGVLAKKASVFKFMSFNFIIYYLLEIIVLGIYAVAWQQIIKKFDVSVAYANRSIALIWALLWSTIFFNERITIQNIIGTIIVILGIVVVNLDE